MLGLFQSKSEKLVKKIYKTHRELCSGTRTALRKNTDFWWNYVFETGEQLQQLFLLLSEEKGEDYAENILMALVKEQSMPIDLQELILEKFMMTGNMGSFGKVFLVGEEEETEIMTKWSDKNK